MQILVLGMHRSGTSLITRLLNMLGAYVGAEKTALEHHLKGIDPANTRGNWERTDVVAINNAQLGARGCSWRNPARWAEMSPKVPAPGELRRTMQLLVLDMDAHRPWVMKDPRLCVTLADWLPLLEVPVGVVVSRDPHETALSLARLAFAPPISLEHGLALWEYYTVTLLNASRGMPRIFVGYQDCLARPQAIVEQLHAELTRESVVGLRMPSAREINAFVDPAMRRASTADARDLPPLNSNQRLVMDVMRHRRPQEGPLEVSAASMRTLGRAQETGLRSG